jgi:hypothetical protein
MRRAFTGFSVERGHIVVAGNFVAAWTFMAGTFDRPLTRSPVGEIPPHGATLHLRLLNIFRFAEDGTLAEVVPVRQPRLSSPSCESKVAAPVDPLA